MDTLTSSSLFVLEVAQAAMEPINWESIILIQSFLDLFHDDVPSYHNLSAEHESRCGMTV